MMIFYSTKIIICCSVKVKQKVEIGDVTQEFVLSLIFQVYIPSVKMYASFLLYISFFVISTDFFP